MKTKLLRKVRKRYSIVYKSSHKFPPIICDGTWEVIILIDRDNNYNDKYFFIEDAPFIGDEKYENKEKGHKAAMESLNKWILRHYAHLGTRRNKLYNKQEKLWFNN